jgi:general secretion pathway protein A
VYEEYWGLTTAPFQNVPDPNFFFLSVQHREGLARLLYAVKHNKGAALLVGDVGCGKTTLSRAFIIKLAEDKYDVGLLTNPSLPSNDFLEEVDLQLGIHPTNTNKVSMLRSLNERLLANMQEGKDTVLIVDEAHSIRDPEVFEELRMLLNFQLNDRFLLTLILMGQPEIKEMITPLTQLDQRIAIRYHLKPLDQFETSRYIGFRLQKAGAKRAFFADEALQLVWQQTGGVPRSINTLCDLCLLEGYATDAQVVDGTLVRRVIASLI